MSWITRFAGLIGLAGLLGDALPVTAAGILCRFPPRLLRPCSRRQCSPSDPIMIRIFKMESELEVWKRDKSGEYALLKTYPMCRWSGQLGPKRGKAIGRRPKVFIR